MVEKKGRDSLVGTSIGNFRWSTLSMVSASGTHFAIGILLARLLEPKDFGVVAFAMVFVAITGRITQFGVAPAIIQRRDLNTYHVRCGFTITVLLGLVGYTSLFVVAPYAVSGVRLSVLRVAALGLVISGAGVIAQSSLHRALKFRQLFYVNVVSNVVGYGLTSVTLALLGYGPWSIVLGNLTQHLFRNAGCFILAPHCIVPSFKKREWAELLHYGFGMSIGTLANVLARNGHIFLVGKMMGDALLGIYQRSFTLVMFPVASWNGASTSVLFPTLSKVQDEVDRLGRGFLMSISLSSFFLFPIFAAIALCAPEIVMGLLTAKWRAAIPVIRVFCLFGLFASIYPLGDALGRACGRVYTKSAIHCIYAFVSMVLCYCGTRHGILWVAVAMVASVLLTYILMGILVVRIIGKPFGTFLSSQVPGLTSSAVVIGLCYPVTYLGRLYGLPASLLLLVQVITCISSIGIALYFLPKRLIGPIKTVVLEHINARIPTFRQWSTLRNSVYR